MSRSNQIQGKSSPAPQTSADLTRSNSALADKVLADPSIFPDEFTAWIPRWIMQNVNFKVSAGQLPTLEAVKVIGSGNGQPAFQNSWVAFGTSDAIPGFYKDAWGNVYLQGTLKSGTVGTTMFTLPAGYRPQRIVIFPVASNAAFGVCVVNVDGTVVASAGSNTYFSLAGIVFRAFQ